MSASRYKDRWETEQEETELEEQRLHDEGECEGYPRCYLCIDDKDMSDMVEYTNDQLDKEQK